MKIALTLCVAALTAVVFFFAVRLVPAGGAGEEAAQRLQLVVEERDATAEDLAQARARLTAAEAENAALAAREAEATQERDALRLAQASAEASGSDVEATLETMRTDVETARAAAEALRAQVAGLEEERGTLIAQATEVASALSEAPAVEDGRVAEYAATIGRQVEELRVAGDEVARLTAAEAERARAVSEAGDRVAALEAEIAALAGTVSERDQAILALQAQDAPSADGPVAECQLRSDEVLAGTQVRFADGSPAISTESLPLLDRIAEIAVACVADGMNLEIEGHTDSIGGEASNLLLSNGRARAVFDYLASQGVPAPAMRAMGFGESEPIADVTTIEGQALNRRVVFDWEMN